MLCGNTPSRLWVPALCFEETQQLFGGYSGWKNAYLTRGISDYVVWGLITFNFRRVVRSLKYNLIQFYGRRKMLLFPTHRLEIKGKIGPIRFNLWPFSSSCVVCFQINMTKEWTIHKETQITTRQKRHFQKDGQKVLLTVFSVPYYNLGNQIWVNHWNNESTLS